MSDALTRAEPRSRRRIVDARKAELLEQLEAVCDLAERLRQRYGMALPGPDDSPADAGLRKAVEAMPATTQELNLFTREVLHDYDETLSADQLEKMQKSMRHDVANKIVPVHGVCQEVEITAPPASALPSIASDLRHACEDFTRQLDFFTGARSSTPADRSDARVRDLPVDVAAPTAPARSVRAAKILVADDNSTSAENLGRYLSLHGHDVVIVGDGNEALRRLKADNDFDLVLLDVIMPGLDGTQVLGKMKEHVRLQHVPVIMVSGFADEDRAVGCIAAGAEDYLSKPVNYVLLDARIGSCLRRREAESNKLRQYFSNELSKELACSDDLLKTRDSDVSILFCDIRRFSAISERVGAATTIEWIGDTMGVLSEIVFEHQGVLIDYIGDGLMAMWGAPKPLEDHADFAVNAALTMTRSLKHLNSQWEKRLGEPVRVGIGVNSGIAHVGVIGSFHKFKYGPLGTTVNLASRVEGVTKYLQSTLVVTHHTRKYLQDRRKYSIRRLCRARVVNIKRPVSLYEIRAADRDWSLACKTYERALRLFEKRDLKNAAQVLGGVLYDHDNDVPSQLLMSRVLAAMVDDANFDPVWTFSK